MSPNTKNNTILVMIAVIIMILLLVVTKDIWMSDDEYEYGETPIEQVEDTPIPVDGATTD